MPAFWKITHAELPAVVVGTATTLAQDCFAMWFAQEDFFAENHLKKLANFLAKNPDRVVDDTALDLWIEPLGELAEATDALKAPAPVA